jgi:hypothetical protein
MNNTRHGLHANHKYSILFTLQTLEEWCETQTAETNQRAWPENI